MKNMITRTVLKMSGTTLHLEKFRCWFDSPASDVANLPWLKLKREGIEALQLNAPE